MNMKQAVKLLLLIINNYKKHDEQLLIKSSECIEFRYRDTWFTDQAVKTILAVDDTLSIEVPDSKIWFSIYAGNEVDELIVDYTDNPTCNKIYDDYMEFFKEDIPSLEDISDIVL